MRLYIWKSDIGYGAGIIVVAAEDIESARRYAREEYDKRVAAADAARDVYWKWYQEHKGERPYPSWKRWTDETSEGKAASELPNTGMEPTDDEPFAVIEDIAPGVIADCWYYE